jgi:hypothetical protein
MDSPKPLATLFREGTAKAHESVEHSKGAVWLTRGELDKEEYVRYLMILYYVYRQGILFPQLCVIFTHHIYIQQHFGASPG